MNWDWQVFCEDTIERQVVQGCFGKNGDVTYLDWLLSAWGWTISVSLCALVIALVLGSVIGTLRTLPDRPWTVRLGNAWVELFRNIPLLVQIFLWYHVVPAIFPALKQVPGFLLVVLATFPMVIPFLLIDTTGTAIRVSNWVALAMLYLAGWLLARYSGGRTQLTGVVLVAVGASLILAIIALGG